MVEGLRSSESSFVCFFEFTYLGGGEVGVRVRGLGCLDLHWGWSFHSRHHRCLSVLLHSLFRGSTIERLGGRGRNLKTLTSFLSFIS